MSIVANSPAGSAADPPAGSAVDSPAGSAADLPAGSAADPPADSPVDVWRRLALGVLRKSGRADADATTDDVDALLAFTTYDGITLPALHTGTADRRRTGRPGAVPVTRAGRADGGSWRVRQRYPETDPVALRDAVTAGIAGGADSVWLPAIAAALPEALAGVPLDRTEVVLDAGEGTEEAADALLRLARDRGVPAEALTGNLGVDPLGMLARTGQSAGEAVLTALAARVAGAYPRLRAGTVDATVYHDAGASDAEELAASLATGVAYLRMLTGTGTGTATATGTTIAGGAGTGLGIAAALGQLEFRYAATADVFGTIAKLRAARRLWARVAQACGGPVTVQRQAAVTSGVMMTVRDSWTNALRTTVAGFAAVVGGADALTIQPYDARLGGVDPVAQRLARNTHALLRDEAHLARVADPAGGSWHVEAHTDALAHRAWEVFTEIERAGGMAAALAGGMIGDRIAETWRRRAANIAHRRDPISGVSEFANLAEQSTARPVPHGPAGGLPVRPYALAFEELRDRADAHARRTGAPPRVALVPLGPASARAGRLAFAANLFAAGGIATAEIAPGDPGDPSDPGPPVVCLCGGDADYARQAEPVAAALRAAGAVRVWLAGPPAGYTGVDRYLHTGCDAVEVLTETLDDLGVLR